MEAVNQSRLKEKARRAILTDQQTELRQLIKKGYNPDKHELGETNMFCVAAAISHVSTVEILLHACANVNLECIGGLNALTFALMYGEDETALMLIRNGINTMWFALHPGCPNFMLSFAAIFNHLEALGILLAAGQVHARDGACALVLCSSVGSAAAARVLCDYGVYLETREPGSGWTAPIFACRGGRNLDYAKYPMLYLPPDNYRKLVAFLLGRGANVNAMAPRSKITPLRPQVQDSPSDSNPAEIRRKDRSQVSAVATCARERVGIGTG